MKLIKYPDPILNQPSIEVSKEDLKDVIASVADMTAIMKVNKGVGLAAVQVGILRRYALLDMTKDNWKDAALPDTLLIINPVVKEAKSPVQVSEGCLSLPRFNERLERPSEVVISYKDSNFDDKELTVNGLMAQCIMHEIDHMNGILQLDKLSLMKKQMYIKALKKRDLL